MTLHGLKYEAAQEEPEQDGPQPTSPSATSVSSDNASGATGDEQCDNGVVKSGDEDEESVEGVDGLATTPANTTSASAQNGAAETTNASRDEQEAVTTATSCVSNDSDAATSPPSLPADFPAFGVTSSFLRHVLSQCSEDWTTTDVSMKFVMPATLETKASFAELVMNQSDHDLKTVEGHPSFGTPTVFVSHAWRYSFKTLVTCISEYDQGQSTKEDAGPSYFWVDVFAVNQHVAPSHPHEWWSTTFQEAIRCFGRTLLVLEPWHDPVPLTRAWCL